VVAVLKNEQRALLQDVRGLCSLAAALTVMSKRKLSHWWDFDGLTSWDAMPEPVRVVRAPETVSVRRQRTKQIETMTADWLWSTNGTPTMSTPMTSMPSKCEVRSAQQVQPARLCAQAPRRFPILPARTPQPFAIAAHPFGSLLGPPHAAGLVLHVTPSDLAPGAISKSLCKSAPCCIGLPVIALFPIMSCLLARYFTLHAKSLALGICA
jgi:hypothetical protein